MAAIIDLAARPHNLPIPTVGPGYGLRASRLLTIQAMSLLTKFTRLIEQMEAGSCPPGFSDRSAAFKGLVDQICVAPWQTPSEREKAQGLVARLERLRWAEQQKGRSPRREPA